MKQNRPVKKKKKERTWAEAITESFRQTKTKIMGLREIHEAIASRKLKDIGMTKTDEKNLRTMLAQHTSTPAAAANCSFYRVKDRPGYYGIKEEALHAKLDSPESLPAATLLKRKTKDKGTSLVGSDAKKKLVAKITAGRSNSLSALRKAQLLSRRRTSSPNVMSSFSNLRNRSHLQTVHRSRSTNSLQKPLSNSGITSRRLQNSLDLETPTSLLTNTRLKSILNSATFSMLPTSYQYQLIQLLPQVDRQLDGNDVPRMTPTALSNEFFSQAVQDWSTQLSEGEFTRETQARIMQEISRERSKINPWKEKFFEEYYGQKRELKRTRSRSHDMGGSFSDLSFEAQLAKFKHLSSDLEKPEDKNDLEDDLDVIMVSESESDHDPDYAETGQTAPRPAEKDLVKPINKRKVSRPFKRSIHSYPTNTAMIHRRGAVPSSNIFSRFSNNSLAKFSSSTPNLGRSEFQVRDGTYRSDSDASDAELSDSNSFHQHDDSDDDGESSDDMMNIGDNNLLDVDGENTDSDDTERPVSELTPSKHSHLSLVAKLSSTEEENTSKEEEKTSNNKIEHDVSEQNPKLENCSKATDAKLKHSTEQVKKNKTADVRGKVVEPILSATVNSESVGTLFDRGLQSAVSASYGDSIIPRISTKSLGLNSPTPTTVCTSATPARAMKKKDGNDYSSFPLKSTPSENSSVIKQKKSILDSASSQQKVLDPSNPTLQSLPSDIEIKEVKVRIENLSTGSSDKNVEGRTLSFQSPLQKTVSYSSTQKLSHPSATSSNLNSSGRIPPKPNIAMHQSPVGQKRPASNLSSSPVKRTKTLAEIKAQMKAKRLAVASAAPGGSAPKPAALQQTPVRIARPIFCPTSDSSTAAQAGISKSSYPSTDMNKKSISKAATSSENSNRQLQNSAEMKKNNVPDITVKKDTKEQGIKNNKEKIILKIKKSEVVKNCDSTPLATEQTKSSLCTDEEDVIVRKTRRSSQVVIMSSGDSSDDLEVLRDLSTESVNSSDNYSMLTQLALPMSSSLKSPKGEHHSLLKLSQKSPVFGESPFDVISSMTSAAKTASSDDATKAEVKPCPFMSNKPVIGFQDIPSCSALSTSTTPTFVQPASTITQEPQKYRSTSKGKSLVQMQQLAQNNRMHSDESDLQDSDTEDDSTTSTTSSADDDRMNRAIGRSQLRKRDPNTGKVEKLSKLASSNFIGKSDSLGKKNSTESSDCDDTCSSSSSEDKPIITECICSCKRLVLCKGCGAYTHEECLSSAKLCSLCV